MRPLAAVQALVLFVGLIAWASHVQGQAGGPPAGQQARLVELKNSLEEKGTAQKAAAQAWAKARGVPFRSELPDGKVLELQRLGPNGPVFYITNNIDAADTISTDEVWAGPGFSLRGDGLTVGEWDSGRVLLEHPDLHPRAAQMDEADDPPPVHSDHATHVAGTLIGSGGGNYPQAIGMAPLANLQAWDWNRDLEEMADAALAGLLVSNHSYSIAAGWIPYGQAEPNNWWWIGGAGNDEDPNFGYYDAESQALDQIANNAPHYLIVKAAGNDRWDIGPNPGETYTIVDQEGVSQGTSTQSRPADCGQTGYDCLPGSTVAKNILTVGAVNDVNGGYLPLQGPASVQMTGFSSFGPTDDGRIKPDLVANGWLLLSTWGAPNYFAVIAGTSMAAPSVSGSLLLLQEHYRDNDPGGNFMRAATLKGLAIHSADETGAADGPDYEFGWGLMNTRKAAEVISGNGGGDHLIFEDTRADQPVENPDEFSFTVVEDGARVRVTLVWNDPAAAPAAPTLDPTTSMLVNDLDLRVVGNGSVFQPWVLNPLSPSSPATRGNNTRDNVEQVDFVAAAGDYTVQVSNQPGLQGGEQDYSLIVSVGAPVPLSSGLIIDEHFDGGVQPAGWSVDTISGIPWDFFQDGSGELDNRTGSSGGYAMLYNQGVNDTLSWLILPPLDLSTTESVVMRFDSYYSFGDGSENIRVYTSADGGSSWSLAQNFSVTNHFPTNYPLDLTNKIAGSADARIGFRFDSGFLGVGGWNWQVDAVEVEVFGGGSSGGGPPPPLELPGQADMPSPTTGETDVATTTTLYWISAPTADSHNVYFGTSLDLDNSDFHGNQAATQFSPGNLAADTTYFWRIDEVNASGTTAGVTWNFTTEAGSGPPPGPTSMHVVDLDMASEPQPRNRWTATVKVRLKDDEGSPVSAASVSGQWSDGTNGSDTQATDGQGWASFTKANLKAGVSSVTFSVTSAIHAALDYEAGANSDPDGDSDGSTIVVLKDAPPPPANEAPDVTVTSPADQQRFSNGAGITLAATASDTEDDNATLVITWNVNSQQVGTGASISHNFPDGVHTITASTIDSVGASASDSVSITVGDPPATADMRVTGLEDLSTASSRRWTAAARVTVLDSANQAVQGATVSGSWSSGVKGGASCSTDGNGQCELSKGNLKLNVESVTLTITGVSAPGMNFDPTGPSSITLTQP